jgi:hypothetical protein
MRQSFNQMIHSQPQRPTVMIERERKGDAGNEQDGQNGLVTGAREDQTEKVDEQNHTLSRDYIRHYRADKKSLFPFEDYRAGSAPPFDIERPLND